MLTIAMVESPSTSHFSETLKLLGNDSLKNDNADIQEFQKRVKTFILDQKWVGKPSTLSPSVCARFGWKCCGPNKLQCVSCSAILCTSLPEMEKCTSYDKCIAEVLNKLKTTHKKHCPWPLAPSPENFFQMVPIRKEAAFEDFVSRLESLLSIEAFLPEVKDTVAEALALSGDYFKALCELCHISDSPFAKSAILLAATGWRRMPDAGKRKYVTCVHCQRTVGVWFYSSVQSESRENCTPKEEGTSELQSSVPVSSQLAQDDVLLSANSTPSDKSCDKNVSVDSSLALNCEETVVCKQESTVTSESPNHLNGKRSSSDVNSTVSEEQTRAKKRKLCLETDVPFDPLYEHRPWCMWISRTGTADSVDSNKNHSVQSLSSNAVIPGYKMYIECLLKNVGNSSPSPSCSFSSPTREQLSNARELLMTWSSPV